MLLVPYKFDCWAILYPVISVLHDSTMVVINWGSTYWVLNPPLWGTIYDIETGSTNCPTEIPKIAGSNS